MANFLPQGTAKISATQTSGRATLAGSGANGTGTDVICYNAGPDLAFVEIGNASVVATVPTSAGTGSQPVPVGYFGFTIGRSPDSQGYVAAICGSGETATVYFSVGKGQ
jgi:hypothetical protein